VPPLREAARDAEENKVMAVLAYILFFIPLLAGAHKTSPFVRHHANQGTVLFIASALYGVAYSILSMILAFIPFFGWALIGILGIAGIAPLVLCIIGIVNAANGTMKALPVIGSFTVIK
jgi:uncharacterized membrane protein